MHAWMDRWNSRRVNIQKYLQVEETEKDKPTLKLAEKATAKWMGRWADR
jgi:hypothetical protein